MQEINTESLIERLCDWYHGDDKDRKQIARIEKELNIVDISVDVCKHNALQFTYYFEVDYGLESNFFIEIENGVNNGTQVNSADWAYNTKPESKTVEVLKDALFSNEKFEQWCEFNNVSHSERPRFKSIAKNLFKTYKDELMKANRNQSYDNYVTGGGTLKTNQYYHDLYKKLSDKGVFWTFVYEEVEADLNFV